MTPDLTKLNKEVQTRFELLSIAEMTRLDEATTKAKAEGKLEQRMQSTGAVQRYARDILNGDWQLNPQPITITKEGWLLDGWHRIKAGIQSGQSVVFNVTRNWPTHSTFKVVDTGRGRNVNQLLQMQGITYTNRRTGIVNTLIQICAGWNLNKRALSIHELERVTHLFEKSINVILEMRNRVSAVGNPSPVVGSFVFLHNKFGDPVQEFAEDYFTLRFSETHPARALKRWVDNNTSKDIRSSAVKCTMNCLHAYIEKQPMVKAFSSQTGLDWARKLQADQVAKVQAIVGAK